jgi:hypothetical protein
LTEENSMIEEKSQLMDQSELNQSQISAITEADIEEKFK